MIDARERRQLDNTLFTALGMLACLALAIVALALPDPPRRSAPVSSGAGPASAPSAHYPVPPPASLPAETAIPADAPAARSVASARTASGEVLPAGVWLAPETARALAEDERLLLVWGTSLRDLERRQDLLVLEAEAERADEVQRRDALAQSGLQRKLARRKALAPWITSGAFVLGLGLGVFFVVEVEK